MSSTDELDGKQALHGTIESTAGEEETLKTVRRLDELLNQSLLRLDALDCDEAHTPTHHPRMNYLSGLHLNPSIAVS